MSKGCGIEFPHFGAIYPDARCCDGYLWDMDSWDESLGGFTIGGDEPCPVCNTEVWLESVVDEDYGKLVEVQEEPVSEDLEEAAIEYCGGNKGADARVRAGFTEGAKWKEKQMMAKAVDAKLLEDHLIRQKGVTHPLHIGDKVKVIIIKSE